MRQQKLFRLSPLTFGGDSTSGKAKVARPLSAKRPLHVVMKVDPSVTALSSLKNRGLCQREIGKWADRFGISILSRSVNSNHIHLIIRGKTRTDTQNFLRVVPRQIAQKLQGKGKFWLGILFSRVLQWGRDYRNAMAYVEKNTLEMAGPIVYKRSDARPRGSPH